MATVSTTIELVDKISTKLNTIKRNIDDVEKALDGVGDQQDVIDKFSWDTFLKNAEAAGKKMESIGKSMSVAISAPLALLGKKMYGNAVDYESAFAGVKKTTDATEAEYEALYNDLLGISERTPTGFVEGAGIMEMAGQLGVAKDQLTGFTEAYIGLQESTNIQGEGGAADLARFLNVTEKTTENVDRVAGVIVGLGNNFATTENEILSMATRMGATADLAGYSSAEILAFSAALSSVGINAEAGGSAAGKLMKRMQLAAEVGGRAQEQLSTAGFDFESGLEAQNWIDTMKSADLADVAYDMGMTKDALEDMVSSWLALDQFSQVMGLDQAGFLQSWDEGAAQSMLKFFQGLGNLDEDAGNSVLAQLAEMDLTEIRLSNLVAAMAGNSNLFAAALEEAYKQYNLDPAVNAMAEEVSKRYATQESQNEMLGNKLNNTMADFGQNLVDALNPALEVVNDILDKFNSLSEVDQTHIIELLAALAITGPALTAVGKTVEAVTSIAQGIQKLKNAKPDKIAKVLGSITDFALNTPVGNFLLIAGAVAGIAAAIESIPTDAEKIWDSLKDIQITVDEQSVNETLAAIQQVKEAAEQLKNPAVSAEYENTSSAVAMGYGTNTMFGNALGYEATKANSEIDALIADYSGKLREIESSIANATTEAEKAEWFGKYEQMEAQMDSEVSEKRRLYSEKVSDLFNGMAAQYPEAAQTLEQANQQYDLLGTVLQAQNFDWTSYADEMVAEADWNSLMKNMYSKAFDLGYMDYSGYTKEQVMGMVDDGFINNAGFIENIYAQAMRGLTNSAQTISGNPILASFLQSIISDDSVLQNLDFTAIQGAFDGIVETLDFKDAMEQAAANGNVNNFGQYLTQSLADGITANSGLVQQPSYNVGSNISAGMVNGVNSGSGALAAAVRSMVTRAIAAGNAAAQIHSPSRLTYWSGSMMVQGYVDSIEDGRETLDQAVQGLVHYTEGSWNDGVWDNIASFTDLENKKMKEGKKSKIKLSDSEMSKIRDLAEREVINKFTTAELHVDFTANNQISNDLDLDGVVTYLSDKVAEQLEIAAEGVH